MELRRDDLSGSAVQELLREHLRDMHALSPPESVHALDLEALRRPEVTFWTAWQHGALLGCGALKELDARHGEIKSMRTATAHRRKGVAGALLAHLLAEALSRGYTRVSLETGSAPAFVPARELYHRHGFESCPPFAEYREDPNSVFLTLQLDAPATRAPTGHPLRSGGSIDLVEEYRRQYSWRSWRTIYDRLPPLAGSTVLDLGCGVGDQAADVCAAGARVIGVDANAEVVAAAAARGITGAEFRAGDLRALPLSGVRADGLWSSFTAAYFPDLAPVLAHWREHLRPGGWIALTEVDAMFGHGAVSARTSELLEAYAVDGRAQGRYDFDMGRRLRAELERAGFVVENEFSVPDLELSFDGPATPEVVTAWRARFDRMTLLQRFCGAEFGAVRDEFLTCLVQPKHRSSARVVCCIGHT
jgi:putative acetyltransferase